MKQIKLISLFAGLLLCTNLWADGSWESGDCNVTLSDGVLTVSKKAGDGNGAMANYTGTSGIPWYTSRNSITSVVVAEGVTRVGKLAFQDLVKATTISLPSTLQSIGEHAMRNCSSITTLTIPAAVVSIEKQAIYQCSKLTEVNLLGSTPPALPNPDGVFLSAASSLRLKYPDGADNAYASADGWVDKWWDKLYNAVTGEHAPAPSISGDDRNVSWSLDNYHLLIGGTVAAMDISNPAPWKKYSRFIRTATVGAHTTVYNAAFSGCDQLTSVTFTKDITAINRDAFSGCKALKTITIPASVRLIDRDAFKGCTSIEELYCNAYSADLTWTDYNTDDFITPASSKTTICYIPAASLTGYLFNCAAVNVTFGVDLADNSASIATDLTSLADKTTVMKISRTMYKDGAFNTLCLPFSLASFTGTPLEDAQVYEYVSSEMGDNSLHINIREVDAIEAGKPYLVSWASGENMSSMVFRNVTITATEPLTVTPEEGDDIKFVGVLAQANLPANENYLFLKENNILYYPEAAGTMDGFRAYFRVDGSGGGGGGQAPARFRILPKQLTDIESVQNAEIRGQKVIENGVMYLMQQGQKYNVQGQIVK